MNDLPMNNGTRVGMFQVAILVLTILLLLGLAADTVWSLPKEVSHLIGVADTAVCVLLLVDFFIRLYRAENKLAFLKWGWIDLLASIPNVEALRWGRLVRILRIFRLLRGFRSLHRVLMMIIQNRMEAGVASLGLAAFLLVSFCSVSILVVERNANGNIKTAEDALWWSVTTITTVGYGDKYPVTSEGRILGALLMIGGVGMFSGLSGMVASFFLGGQNRDSAEAKEILARLDQLQVRLEALSRERPEGA